MYNADRNGEDNMFIKQRQQIILNMIEKTGNITVEELVAKFNVSAPTIRADLNALAENHLLIRTHGGAIRAEQETQELSIEKLYDNRKDKNNDEKKIIAQKAINFIDDGDCIVLDASSTCYEVAKLLLSESMNLTILTHGLRTANLLKESPFFNVIIIGGVVKRGSNAIEGTLGLDIVKKFTIDKFFTSSYAVSIDDGLSDFSIYESELKTELIDYARQTFALIDHTKFEKNSIVKFGELSKLSKIITDNDLLFELKSEYEKIVPII